MNATDEIKWDETWIKYYEVRRLTKLCERLVRINKQRHKVFSQIEKIFNLGDLWIGEIINDSSDLNEENSSFILQSIINGVTLWYIEGQIENLKQKQKDLGLCPKKVEP